MNVPFGQIAKWSAIGLGAAGLVGVGAIALRTLLDDSDDVPGLDREHGEKPAGAPRSTPLSMYGPLGAGVTLAQSTASHAFRDLFGDSDSNHRDVDGSTPLAQATDSWRALHEQMAVRGLPGTYHSNSSALGATAVWGFGQNIAAAMDLAHLTGDWSATNDMMARLPLYERGGEYASSIAMGGHEYFWDDNMWVGLDLMQAYSATGDRSYLDRALELVPFLEEGLQDGGGVLWMRDNERPSFNTCTNGPALELLLRLYEATGREDLLRMATQIDSYMERSLRREDGLYHDNVAAADPNSIGRQVYSYNQGTPIGADVLWYRITGDADRLEHAKKTANAALDWLATDDKLWKQPPVFNAVFFRNLMALDQVAPDPRYRAALQAYVDRGWREARDPETGLFTKGDIGSYETDNPGSQIDQSGWVQMQALLAMPTGSARPDVA